MPPHNACPNCGSTPGDSALALNLFRCSCGQIYCDNCSGGGLIDLPRCPVSPYHEDLEKIAVVGVAGRHERPEPAAVQETVDAEDVKTELTHVRFRCPNCSRRVKAPVRLAGTASACPGCKAVVEIPQCWEDHADRAGVAASESFQAVQLGSGATMHRPDAPPERSDERSDENGRREHCEELKAKLRARTTRTRKTRDGEARRDREIQQLIRTSLSHSSDQVSDEAMDSVFQLLWQKVMHEHTSPRGRLLPSASMDDGMCAQIAVQLTHRSAIVRARAQKLILRLANERFIPVLKKLRSGADTDQIVSELLMHLTGKLAEHEQLCLETRSRTLAEHAKWALEDAWKEHGHRYSGALDEFLLHYVDKSLELVRESHSENHTVSQMAGEDYARFVDEFVAERVGRPIDRGAARQIDELMTEYIDALADDRAVAQTRVENQLGQFEFNLVAERIKSARQSASDGVSGANTPEQMLRSSKLWDALFALEERLRRRTISRR